MKSSRAAPLKVSYGLNYLNGLSVLNDPRLIPKQLRWLFFQHFEELRFGDAIALACFDQHFSADAAITENGSNTLRNGAAVAESFMR